MSTNFPTSLDSYTAKVDGTDYPQAAHINNPQDAIVALETKVGIDSSAVATSLDYLLKNTTGGHDHDGSDSKKVIATNLNVTGLTASQLIRVNSGASAIESSGKTAPTGDIVGSSDTQTLTNKTITQPTITLKQSAAPTPTAEGDIQWDTDDNKLLIGDGSSAKTFVSTAAVSGDITMTTAGVTTIAAGAVSAAKLASTALAAAWPIGSVFISVVSTDPATLLGFGTWATFAAGKFLVGLDSGDSSFDVAEETGGEKTHTLTTAEMPSHTHTVVEDNNTGASFLDPANLQVGITGSPLGNGTTSSTGGGGAHNNLPPYIVCYMWKRVS